MYKRDQHDVDVNAGLHGTDKVGLFLQSMSECDDSDSGISGTSRARGNLSEQWRCPCIVLCSAYLKYTDPLSLTRLSNHDRRR